jgi:ABC-type glycerol-3-phosphate transport system substrate-binding protein
MRAAGGRPASIGLVLLSLCVSACKKAPERGGLGRVADLEVFSGWTTLETPALDVLVKAHRTRRPNIQLANIAVPNRTNDPEQVLNWRMGLDAQGRPDRRIIPHPPSLMLWDIYDLQARWLDQGVRFVPLDELFASEGWTGKFYDFLEPDLKKGGHYVNVPLGMSRENTLIFNRRLLRDLHVAEASLSTWEGLLAACEVVKRAGRTCLSLTQESWVNAIAFRSVAAAVMGPARFRAFFGRQGDRDEPSLVAAVQAYKALFQRGYVGGWDNRRRLPSAAWGWEHVRKDGWVAAVRDVHDGRAAFCLHGDWGVWILRELGWGPGELGVVVAPGTQGLVLVDVDGALIPVGGGDGDLALDVLRTWGQPATLATFARVTGDSPPRPDVLVEDNPLLDFVRRDLRAGAVPMTPPIFLPADAELLAYLAGTRTLEQAVSALRAALYPPARPAVPAR